MARLLGSGHTATAVTLAVFLAGLSLGYALCGQLTTRVRNHLRTYALLEALAGSWALAFPWIFAAVERWTVSWSFRAPWLLATQGLLVASLLLLAPALLMGATVPFLTRIAGSTVRELTSVHAFVYGTNTAGAFAGALAAGFWLIPAFGLPGTLGRGSLANLVSAGLFLALAMARKGTVPIAGASIAEPPSRARFSPALLCAIAVASGIETMALENVVFRSTAIALGPSSYTFAMVVAVFVAAIAAGSLAVSRLRRLPAWLLAANQLLVALSLVAIWLTLDDWPYWVHLLRLGFGTTPVAFYLFHAAALLGLLLLFAVPVTLLGAR